ncbi:MAG: hypothetical protein ACI8Z5_002353, partial [Lentimonas sp.]
EVQRIIGTESIGIVFLPFPLVSDRVANHHQFGLAGLGLSNLLRMARHPPVPALFGFWHSSGRQCHRHRSRHQHTQ